MGKQRINWEGDFINIEEQIDLLKKGGDFQLGYFTILGFFLPKSPLL